MTRRRRQPRAFTLLELLVATAMIAVLAASLYATLHVAFRARGTAWRVVDEMRKAELAVELVRADIDSALVPRGILAGKFLGEDAVNGTGRASDTLLLYRAAAGALKAEPTGDVRMVELACESDGDNEGMALVRRVSANLLMTKVEEPAKEVLCRDVRSLSLRYFDGMEWQDSWDSGLRGNELPRAVEVTLELTADRPEYADVGGYWVSRVFLVPCSSVATGMQVEMFQP